MWTRLNRTHSLLTDVCHSVKHALLLIYTLEKKIFVESGKNVSLTRFLTAMLTFLFRKFQNWQVTNVNMCNTSSKRVYGRKQFTDACAMIDFRIGEGKKVDKVKNWRFGTIFGELSWIYESKMSESTVTSDRRQLTWERRLIVSDLRRISMLLTAHWGKLMKMNIILQIFVFFWGGGGGDLDWHEKLDQHLCLLFMPYLYETSMDFNDF